MPVPLASKKYILHCMLYFLHYVVEKECMSTSIDVKVKQWNVALFCGRSGLCRLHFSNQISGDSEQDEQKGKARKRVYIRTTTAQKG